MGAMALMSFTMKYALMQDLINRIILIDIPCVKMENLDSWKTTGIML